MLYYVPNQKFITRKTFPLTHTTLPISVSLLLLAKNINKLKQ